MIKVALAIGLVLAAAQSCATTSSEPVKAPPAPPAQTATNDTCGAAALQSLIGKSKDQIPPKPANAAWRVTCTSCAVTMDYSPARLNILFDEKTGIVKTVRCG